MDPDLIELLQDARDLISELGLGEYGYMDPKAHAMVDRIDQKLQDDGAEPKPQS